MLFQVSCLFVSLVAYFCFTTVVVVADFVVAATGAAAFLIASLSVSNENDNVRDLQVQA